MDIDRKGTATRAVAVAAAMFAAAVGLRFGTYSAADTDPYGYVSQADLIAAGTLHIQLHPAMFPVIDGNDAAWAAAGYVLAGDGRSIVPMYPPGLPAVMAALQRITGQRAAAFYVVPFVAALAVLATYGLGARSDTPQGGAMAAVLLATNPVFLSQTMQPVSDVPATAWWIAALMLVLQGPPALALPAGLLTSMAVLTRPHLVPLAALIGVFLIVKAWTSKDGGPRRQHQLRLAWFAVGSVPGALAVAALNDSLHGSPLLSGYGSLGDLFRWEHVVPNIDRYPRWLIQTTPFASLALLAPIIIRPGRGDSRLPADVGGLLACWAAVVFLLTIFYGYFDRDQWQNVRFLLPALPVLLVLGAVVVGRLIGMMTPSSALRTALLVTVAIAVSAWQLVETRRLAVFRLHEIEQRYVDVGMFVGRALPQSAVFISGLHSGSIRYYANRPTIYYPRLRQGSLDLAITTLQDRGREVYVVLEDGERSSFSNRFAASDASRLDWPPAARTSRGVAVSIWHARDREPFLRGAHVTTSQIDRPQTAGGSH